VQQRDQPVKFTVTCGGMEGVDDLALAGTIRTGCRRARPHAAARAAGQLAGRLRCPLDHRSDLVKRHREHVVQHERKALGGRQRLQDDEQGEADRVGQQRRVLRVLIVALDDRIGYVPAERLLTACLT
jgi:hypothetical protein